MTLEIFILFQYKLSAILDIDIILPIIIKKALFKKSIFAWNKALLNTKPFRKIHSLQILSVNKNLFLFMNSVLNCERSVNFSIEL
ncbi:hypothetical protein BpHYR1_020407 [Brachionus plicatilis]|uniref:Uncharacterized protein n=1 Tax=Brachionus plicatilis TaxID=10195 RepID=A0A3M7R6I9_BRAPC|nr:hypothetical protein BpHYR1_020407 [Brachionus plicatilis]